jgi:mono/diheme cytochrome c family protein
MKAVTLTSISLFVLSLYYFSSCQSNISIQTAQYAVNGQKLYKTHCENCHGAKGEGLGKLYPPLTDHDFLTENRSKLSCIVKYGLHEEIEVLGEKYDQLMPANPTLTDVDIAYILTYVTTTFGQSDSTYTQEEVKTALGNCN